MKASKPLARKASKRQIRKDRNTSKIRAHAKQKTRRLQQTTLYTGSRRPENRTFQKCLPSPLESTKNESVQTTGHESVQTSRLSANTECFPSPLESIKTNCNWRRKRPNHWPRKRPNQPPALQQTTIYTGPRRPENRTFQKCLPSP